MCVGQGLYAPIVQPIIRGIFESKALEFLKGFTKWRNFSLFKVDKRFHEISLELVLSSSHNSCKEITINMGGRNDIHGTSSWNVQHTSMLGCQHKSNWSSPCTHQSRSNMGKKRSQTHTSSRDKRQKRNYNSFIIFSKWVNVTFISCVPRHNKLGPSTHEWKKKKLSLKWFSSYV